MTTPDTAVRAVETRPPESARSTPPMPREQGAWGILLVPFATAAGSAGVWNWPLTLLLVSVLGFYLARTSYLKQQTAWTVLLLAASAAAGAPLLLVWHRWWLLLVGGIAAPLAFRKTDRSVSMQLLAVGGLTLTAPAAWYAATATLGRPALALWVLNALYFAGGVFYVKMHIAAARQRTPLETLPEKWRVGAATVIYYLLLPVILLGMAMAGAIPFLVVFAYGPVVARAWAGVWRLTPVLRIKRLGWTEVAYSVGFAIALVLAWRVG